MFVTTVALHITKLKYFLQMKQWQTAILEKERKGDCTLIWNLLLPPPLQSEEKNT